MSGGGSVVVRRQLGSKLRRLRLAAGKDVADVARPASARRPRSVASRPARVRSKIADVRALCWLYGADSATTERSGCTRSRHPARGLVAGLRSGRGARLVRAVRRTRGDGEPDPLRRTGVRARVVADTRVRARPSSPPTTSSAMRSCSAGCASAWSARRRSCRPTRQPSVTVVLGEAALSLVVGSPEVMATQIEHLHDGDSHPNIDVRVLPFSAGAYPRRGSFALLDFDDDEDPSVAYVEGPGGARYYDRPDERAEYEHVWKILFGRSTPIEEWTR